jgi:ATP-dependent helicase/nuclease subunit A
MIDQAERQRLREDFQSNFLVEAAPGSGKTHCLVERVHAGIRNGAYLPQEVAVMTFTRKAAGELRQRLKFQEPIWVGTIHSFCAQILRWFPVEVGLTPQFQDLNPAQRNRLRRQAFELTWREPDGQRTYLELSQLGLRESDLYSAFQGFLEHRDLEYPSTSPNLYGQTVALLEQTRINYTKLCRQAGLVDPQDLLWLALNLLKKHPLICGKLQKRFPFLLVDEFQDTDPQQAHLLELWAGGEQLRPGSLFLVGDPKQSIYRFRRASMEIYHKFRERLTVVELRHTFRCNHQLCQALNQVFSSLFPTQANPHQAGFVPLHSERQSEAESALLHLVSPDLESEASSLARWVGHKLQCGYRPSDFLVITGRKKFLGLYQRAFQEKGIAVDSPAEEVPLDSDLEALVVLLQHLVDPQNKVVLAGVLRGPFFGHSDPELFEHVRLAGTLRPYPAGTGHPAITASLALLDQWRVATRWLPPGTALHWLARESGLDCLMRAEGAAKWWALQAMLDQFRDYSAQGLTLADAVSCMLRSRTLQIQVEPTGEAIRLVNLHKAKGLEARVVILTAGLGGNARSSDHITTNGSAYFRLRHQGRVVLAPEPWESLQSNEKIGQQNEQLRLLYVAATRAQETLVVGQLSSTNRGPWKKFLEPLGPIPQLTIPEQLQPLPTPYLPPPPRPGWTISWRRETATRHRRTQSPQSQRGHFLHRMLEFVLRGYGPEELRALGLWLARQEADFLANWEAELNHLEELRKGHFFQNWVGESQRILCEIPFGLRMKGATHFGTIDLAIYRRSGWAIIDHKTGQAEQIHLRQILTYASAWKQLTSLPLAYAGLFLIDSNRLSENLIHREYPGRRRKE